MVEEGQWGICPRPIARAALEVLAFESPDVGIALAVNRLMGKKVLIVEDEVVLRKHLARLLVRQGYEVATAASRAEALDELGRGSFEALLLDVRLPDGDGLDLLAGLGEEQRPPHTVVMTAHSTPEHEELAGRLHVSRFLHKPFDLYQFHQFIGAVRQQLPPELDRDPPKP